MKVFGKRLDHFEAAARSGNQVAWFGSVQVDEEKVTVTPGGRWWSGDELANPPATLPSGREHFDPAGTWYHGLSADEYNERQRRG